MNFDDHEIWGAPVRAAEDAPESAVADTPAPASATAAIAAGRLYRSAGSDPHPEAILALPQHRRHTTALPLEATQWASAPAPNAPITINSRIPRPSAIDDPALAEIATSPSAATPAPGFTSWFKTSNPLGAIAALRQTNTGVETAGETPERSAFGALSGLGAIGGSRFTPGAYALLLFVVTAVVGVVDAAVSGSLGAPTGAALLVATAVGTWRIDGASRWAAWVIPSYALIAAILVAGQFTDSAPGASPLGQVMLVATALITMAPWLAAASAVGAALPALRGRAK